ncbi:MAG: sigma-70 family RNA polymerase sigma factor [Phycisphaerales bacterium]|nr:MAG: sigma-70 family RNA polymerase sigma factor [Phycisphaerales bacterium]
MARGEEAGVREFNARYAGLVWSIVRRLGVPSVEAEDAVQDIFVELWRSADRFDASIASEPAFVAMIARRRAIDRIRRVSRQADGVALSEAIEAEARVGGWRGSAAGRGESSSVSEFPATTERAVEALDRLSPDQQRVLRLSLFRGLSHELIARSLDMPLGTVKTHARRGLIRLRDLLSERREVAT